MAERNWYKIVECSQTRQHTDRGTEINGGNGVVAFKHVEGRTPNVQLRLDPEDYELFVRQLSSESCKLPAKESLSFQVQELLCKHGNEPWKVVMRASNNFEIEFEVDLGVGLILMREMLEDMEDNY